MRWVERYFLKNLNLWIPFTCFPNHTVQPSELLHDEDARDGKNVSRDDQRWQHFHFLVFSLVSIMRHVENGVIDQMYNCMDREARRTSRASKVSLFQNVEEFVDEYSGKIWPFFSRNSRTLMVFSFPGFSDLVIDNFRYIFRNHAIICSLVLAAFCAHHLVKFLVKKYPLFVRHLRELWQTNFWI